MPKVEILEQKGYYFLWIDNELWMWDVPNEVEDQKQIAEQAYGDVLVAGYGLGLVQKFLLKNTKVKSVLSIEILEDVIKECTRVFGKIYGNVKVNDFFHYNSNEKFDCIVGDAWLDQSMMYVEDYKKFRHKASELLKEDGKILGWGADYMDYLVQTKSI